MKQAHQPPKRSSLIRTIIIIGIVALITILFCYSRTKPLFSQTVAYTYDQGRDFLKAAEIVLYKNPTFIGPTTGIMGIYHGAWWYYILTIPFTIFNGHPIGFYWFNFVIHFASYILLFLFVKRYFGITLALLSSTLVAISGYFSFTSTFVGNNIMVLPSLLLWLMIQYIFMLKPAQAKWFFLNGLLLGLTAEFEFAFGLFLIPSYFLSIFFIPLLRNKFFVKKSETWFRYIMIRFFFLAGLVVAFAPRLMFELKNNFLQTKTLISYFFAPKYFNPKPFINILNDRIMLFKNYFESIFPYSFFSLIFLGLAIISICSFPMRKKGKKIVFSSVSFQYAMFTLLLSLLLFIGSLTYKDNFWGNYYEGIQYLFLLSIIAFISLAHENIKKIVTPLLYLLLILLLCIGLKNTYESYKSPTKLDGMIIMEQVVEKIHREEKSRPYCVRVYTPPVIPYTYEYLFLYERLSKKISDPIKEWQNNRCWFIEEKESVKERVVKWKAENYPKEYAVLKKTEIKDITILLLQAR